MSSNSRNIFEHVYRDNAEKLYRFFYFKVLEKSVAEDLTSETFMALAEKIPSLEPDKVLLEKYLYGIAKNVWNMYLRKKYRNGEIDIANIDDFSEYVTDEVEAMQSRSLKERALFFINQLPTAQKVVAMLRLIDGLLPSEIAIRIDKPLNYVKVTLRRALKRLRELVAQNSLSRPEGADT